MSVGCPRHASAATHYKEDWVGPMIFRNGCKKYLPHRLRSPDRPARSDWLHRLSYSGPHCCCRSDKNGNQPKLCLLYLQLCYVTYWSPVSSSRYQTITSAPGQLWRKDWHKPVVVSTGYRWKFLYISTDMVTVCCHVPLYDVKVVNLCIV